MSLSQVCYKFISSDNVLLTFLLYLLFLQRLLGIHFKISNLYQDWFYYKIQVIYGVVKQKSLAKYVWFLIISKRDARSNKELYSKFCLICKCRNIFENIEESIAKLSVIENYALVKCKCMTAY